MRPDTPVSISAMTKPTAVTPGRTFLLGAGGRRRSRVNTVKAVTSTASSGIKRSSLGNFIVPTSCPMSILIHSSPTRCFRIKFMDPSNIAKNRWGRKPTASIGNSKSRKAANLNPLIS